jgi:phosphatidylglycerophosphatase A
LAAVIIAALLPWHPLVLAGMALLLTPIAIWSAGATAREIGREDPGLVVIDEVVGQWITLSGASHLNWKSLALGFALFRLFDVWKPWPARRFEALPGGIGIVADDAMAGVYAALVLSLLGWFNLY